MTTCNGTQSSATMACEGVRCIVCQISGHVHERKVEKESRSMFVARSRLMLIYAAYCDIYPHLQRAFSICDRHSGALHSPGHESCAARRPLRGVILEATTFDSDGESFAISTDTEFESRPDACQPSSPTFHCCPDVLKKTRELISTDFASTMYTSWTTVTNRSALKSFHSIH